MKLGYKIVSASGVALLFLILLSAFTLSNIKTNQSVLQAIYDVNFRNVELSKLVLEQATDADIKTYRLFTWLNNLSASEVTKQNKEINDVIEAASVTVQALQNNMQDVESQRLLKEVETGLKIYKKDIVSAIDMAGVDINMGLSSMKVADDDFLKIKSQIDQLVKITKTDLDSLYQTQLKSAEKMKWISLLLVSISLLASLIIGALVSRQIVVRVRAAIETAEDIAKGNLNHTIPITGQDEITQLLRAISQMQEQLRQVVNSISETTSHLGTISSRIQQSSSSVLTGSETQNQAAHTMSSAVEDLSRSARDIHNLAEEANDAMQESAKLSREEKQTLIKVIESMQLIETSAQKNSQMVNDLGQESEKISSIVKVISDIAEQTNLLALNAAIEAARAGEQGRGFAVVADEVRSLAARTASSTREIANMIESIQTQVNAAVKGIQTSVDAVSKGATLALSAQQTVDKSTTHVTNIASKINHINQALNQQLENGELISRQVKQITQLTEENLHATSTTVDELSQLRSLAQRLNESLHHFH
jgi:methyl-accepting chemotaxis protein